MKRIILFLLITSLTTISCKKDEVISNNDTTENQEKKSKITKTDINGIKYIDYGLSNQAENATSDWTNFKQLLIEVENLKKANLQFFNDNVEIIKTYTLELKNTIPESLNSPEITTRVSVVENTLYALNSESKLERKSKKHMLNSIKELLIAVSNLKLQINKKLEMDSQNIEKPQ